MAARVACSSPRSQASIVSTGTRAAKLASIAVPKMGPPFSASPMLSQSLARNVLSRLRAFSIRVRKSR
jgi:hypothetical protein